MSACSLLTSALWAEEQVPVTLDSVVERIRTHNPDLAAARFLIQEAEGRHIQSGRLSNPELNIDYSQDPVFKEPEIQIGFSQRFPLTSRLRLERNMTATEKVQAENEVMEIERLLIAEARQSIIRILYIQQKRRLLEKQTEILRELASFLKEASSRGEISLLEARQAQVEADLFSMEIRQLHTAEITATSTLQILLGIDSPQELQVEGNLQSPQLEVSVAEPTLRADYQMARQRLEAARQKVDLEQARRYEDVELGVFAGVGREKDGIRGYETETIIGLKIAVPLPLWNRNEGSILEAQARERRREYELSSIRRTILQETESARREMLEWKQLYQEMEQRLLPLANEHAALADESWRQGLTDIQTVLRVQEKRVQLNLTQLEALREFHLSRIRYESSITSH